MVSFEFKFGDNPMHTKSSMVFNQTPPANSPIDPLRTIQEMTQNIHHRELDYVRARGGDNDSGTPVAPSFEHCNIRPIQIQSISFRPIQSLNVLLIDDEIDSVAMIKQSVKDAGPTAELKEYNFIDEVREAADTDMDKFNFIFINGSSLTIPA